MSEPGGWTTPDGWGAPAAPASSPTGPTAYGSPPGQHSPWGSRPVEDKPGVVPLRPLGLGEVLDGAVGVLRRYPRPALGFAAAVALVTTLCNALLLVTAFQPFLEFDAEAFERGDTAALEDALGGAAAGAGLGLLLSIVSGAVLTGAITAVVGKAVLGQPLSMGEAWTAVRSRLLPLIGLALLVLLVVAGTFALAAVAAGLLVAAAGGVGAIVGVPLLLAGAAASVWLYVRFALAPCALVLERVGIGTSLRRSAVLVRRDWWRVFGILLLTVVIGTFVSQVVQLPFASLGAGSIGGVFDPENDVLSPRSLIMGSIGGALAATLVAPFTAGVRALLYVDRRIRAEGLDVSLSAAAAGRP